MKIPYSMPLGIETYLKGAATVGCNDYFVGSIEGTIRSADKGLTWSSIGGPPVPVDANALSAIDDSLLFVIDTFGSIWATDPVLHSTGTDGLFITGANFLTDTIEFCDTADHRIRFLEVCNSSQIDSIGLIGNNSLDYEIVEGLAGSALPDSIRLRFTPSQYGKADASLRITLKDGRIIIQDISMTVKPVTLSITIPHFQKDTICSGGFDSVRVKAPCNFIITNVAISGPDAASFQIVGPSTLSLPSDSVIVIACDPKRTGKLIAVLRITGQDGRTWDFPLTPYVEGLPQLSFIETEGIAAFTDTIGGDVTLRIKIVDATSDGAFSIHFDQLALIYQGASGNSGSDLTIETPDSSSARIGFTSKDSIINVHFAFFPIDSLCTQVWIDSLVGIFKTTACVQLGGTWIQTAVICSPPGCSRQMLARFVRLGVVDLDLQPNPTSGNITIFTNKNLDHATIEVIDAYGVVQKTLTDVLLTPSGYAMQTNDLASGMYHIRVKNDLYSGANKFVIAK
jgi:hypothetical protein